MVSENAKLRLVPGLPQLPKLAKLSSRGLSMGSTVRLEPNWEFDGTTRKSREYGRMGLIGSRQ